MSSERRISTLPPLPLSVYVFPRRKSLPFPLDEPACRVYARGRHCLWHGIRALGLQPGDEVLAPAYHHGSEIEALSRAGLVCRFYEATPTLAPDEAELEMALTPRVRALYLVHYLGFPQDAPKWRAWCDERGVFLIEDVAQSWLASIDGRPLGSFGDLAIFCLYKSFAVPDGGALFSTPDAAQANGRNSDLGATTVLRGHAAWAVARNRGFARLRAQLESVLPQEPFSAEREFELGDPSNGALRATRFLLPRLVDAAAAPRRRANYQLLLDELGDLAPAPFERLQPGASPFAFPIHSEDKAGLLKRFGARQIDAMDLWSAPHPSVPRDQFAAAAARRAQTLALPVHQNVRPDDLERIVEVVRPRSRQAPLRLEQLDTLEPLRGEWDALAASTGNIFATWEFASTWWRQFGGGRRLLLGACRERDGTLVAVLPLYESRRSPLRVVRFLGHDVGDQLEPICAPTARTRAARALRQLLEKVDADIFLGDVLPAAAGWSALLGARVLSRVGSPVLRFRCDTWDDLVATWSSKLRGEARRNERKLAREHDLGFRFTENPEQLAADLEILFALHRARWGRSAFAAREPFHRDFARRALEQGWLRLCFLMADGEAVAATYGFQYGGAWFYYQSGWAARWASYSVGRVLLIHTIREAIESGAREYRFLLGGEGYKYRYARDDAGVETIAVARRPAGRIAVAAMAEFRRRADARNPDAPPPATPA